MIGHLAAAVKADLASRYFPYRVVYGPERIARDGFTENAVVFLRDRDSGDAITAPIGANGLNPDVPFNRVIRGMFVVYARSSKSGAGPLQHEDECDLVCDGVLTAMYRLCKARKLPLQIVESKMLTREDLRRLAEHEGEDPSGKRSADFPGCAARVRFTVGTAVRDVTYPGAARPTGEVYEFADPTINVELGED